MAKDAKRTAVGRLAPPTFTLAITGHRPNRMHIGEARVKRRLELAISALAKGASGRRKIAVSALAEGSDRLFAELALECGFTLHALLPFTPADYETTFGDTSTTPQFRKLLERAQAPSRILQGRLAESTAAYEDVGRKTVDACDILIAVWDGKPAAGRGGTPEIIEYAVARGTPVVWIDAARHRLPVVLHRSAVQSTVPLAKLARRAKPCQQRELSELALQIAAGSANREVGLGGPR